MSQDRDLLELAAKAAGIALFRWSDSWAGEPGEEGFQTGDYSRWNPLTDDGDALRLAVKLGMYIFTALPHSNPTYCSANAEDEVFNGDKCAATRRAIVRAAAEMGKTK